MSGKFYSTKTYGHEVGLSCCFRQHKATSHCNLLHGYAISVRLEFQASNLDDRNWVVDFGGLSQVKDFLKQQFDHTLLVASDDPMIDELCGLQGLGLADVRVLPAVGCEAFAAYIFDHVEQWLSAGFDRYRVALHSVEVREHGANSAIYKKA